jgi:hypothetical protein
VALSNAERQAAYRARKRQEVVRDTPDPTLARLRARILELEEEVRHLKTELAKRPGIAEKLRPTNPSDNLVVAAWANSRPAPKRR